MWVTGCHQVRRQLGIYAVGAAPAQSIARVERHLARCPRCMDEAETLTEVALGLAALTPDDLDGRVDQA